MTAPAPPPLRLGLFAEQGHPDTAFRSGVTRLTGHLVAGCRRRGVELDFFSYGSRTGSRRDGRVRYHAVVPRLPVSFHGLQVDGLDILPLANPGFRAAAGGRPLDVVLATSPGIGTQARGLAHARGVPFAAVYTTDLPHYAEELVGTLPGGGSRARALAREGAWRYLRWLYSAPATDLVLVPTASAREDLLARVPARAEVLGRGADTLEFPGVERPERVRPRLLYVGRIDYGQKNLAVLEEVAEQVPDADLWIVGGGDDEALLRERMAGPVAEGRVHVTGRVDDPDRLEELYLSADVFVFPSIYDTLGQVVLEAQKAGLPVVVRDRGGPKDLVVDGRTGFVTADDAAFVDRVRELARDPRRRASMGRAAKAHADALPGWTDIVDGLLDRLQRLAAEGPLRRR